MRVAVVKVAKKEMSSSRMGIAKKKKKNRYKIKWKNCGSSSLGS